MHSIALALGLGWAAGLNLYAAVFTVGSLGAAGYVELPPDLGVLEDPLVIGAAGVMYVVEFFADKVPGVDTIWDALHTFIRIPAGAVLAAQSIAAVSPEAQLAGALVGGSLAASSHAAKAGSRALINLSPEPVTNWTASVSEDAAVFGGMWAAVFSPVVFFVLLAVFLLALIWLLPRTLRGVRRIVRRVATIGRAKPESPVS